MVIEFGEWRLVPLDGLNWELCHRHAATRGKNAGRVSWHRCGRFYQASTFGDALRFAADCELKERNHGDVRGIRSALAEYEAITAGYLDAVRGLLEAHGDVLAGGRE